MFSVLYFTGKITMTNKNFGPIIKSLLSEGKTEIEIVKLLKCDRHIVYYYSKGLKDIQVARNKKNLKNKHPFKEKLRHFTMKLETKTANNFYNGNCTTSRLLMSKIQKFHYNLKDKTYMPSSFTVKDLISRFGENPKCYLTGEQIDINKPRTYHFDHKIPKSRGGTNSIDNLGICTRDANLCKRDKTPEELIDLCKKILTNNGYEIKLLTKT